MDIRNKNGVDVPDIKLTIDGQQEKEENNENQRFFFFVSFSLFLFVLY